MIYQSQKLRLDSVRTIQSNTVNDILVCRDLNSDVDTFYTVLVVKDHELVRLCLETFRQMRGSMDVTPLVECFSDQGAFCMVFAYRERRPLKDFYTGTFYTLTECETICSNVIITCITCGLPYPLLYLVLTQDQLNLSKDHTVYLTCELDLRELDISKTERDCAVECGRILWELLRPKASEKAYSYRLLEKKIDKNSYSSFMELYKDIQIAAAPEKDKTMRQRFVGWFKRSQEGLFRIILILCIILVIITLVCLLSQIFLGEIPLLRIFVNGFKTIGTESLTR